MCTTQAISQISQIFFWRLYMRHRYADGRKHFVILARNQYNYIILYYLPTLENRKFKNNSIALSLVFVKL